MTGASSLTTIHHMMNSLCDEKGVDSRPRTTVDIRELEIIRSKTRILNSITATILEGEILGLLGPSGCGKTTLMRTIVGAQRIHSGSVTVFGRRAGDRSLRSKIGYVSQDAAVYPDLSVLHNVSYFATLMGAGRTEAQAVIELVGLTERSRQVVSSLSGGQRSRASIACALVGDPELLVLDEPTVGLDPLTREALWDAFRGLAHQGRTLIISSHVMEEAMRCDRLILMREGRILDTSTPDELLRKTGQSSPDAAFLALVRADAENTGKARNTGGTA